MPVLVLVMCLICGIFIPTGAFAVTTVNLKAEATIALKTVTLSDLADITGDDAVLLAGIVIAKSPDGASDMNISAQTVETRIKSRYLGPILMTGAHRCQVVSSRVEVSEEAIKKVFTREILRNSPWKDTGTIEISDIRISRLPKVLQEDTNTIQAKFSSFERYLGFTSATILIGSGPYPERVNVTGKVRLIAEIPVARTKIAQGRVIVPGDLSMKSCDISSNPNAFARLEDCAGKRAKVTLREGFPILPSQVERKPDILKGEMVVIEARGENLVVRDKGIAMKDGYLNESIHVKNASSGRQVFGTIIAASLVQVEP
jgi:flagella basal body P-ring formation protein FlgA